MSERLSDEELRTFARGGPIPIRQVITMARELLTLRSEVERLRERISDLGGWDEGEYVGTRADWIMRCNGAERRAQELEGERDELLEGLRRAVDHLHIGALYPYTTALHEELSALLQRHEEDHARQRVRELGGEESMRRIREFCDPERHEGDSDGE